MFYEFSLEDHVPLDHLLRSIDRFVELSSIRQQLNPFYTHQWALQAFNAGVRAIPEVEECHMIAGGFDYLVKVRTHDIREYRRVLSEQISRLPHVAAASTYVSIESVRDRGVQNV